MGQSGRKSKATFLSQSSPACTQAFCTCSHADTHHPGGRSFIPSRTCEPGCCGFQFYRCVTPHLCIHTINLCWDVSVRLLSKNHSETFVLFETATLRSKKRSGRRSRTSPPSQNPLLPPRPQPSSCRSPGSKMLARRPPSDSNLHP